MRIVINIWSRVVVYAVRLLLGVLGRSAFSLVSKAADNAGKRCIILVVR